MRGTTRNTDPFVYGISGLYDGHLYSKFFENLTPKYKAPSLKPTQKQEHIDEIIEMLKQYGMVPINHITAKFGVGANYIKYLLTYRCPVYETDDSKYLGLLDDNGDPYPVRPMRDKSVKRSTSRDQIELKTKSEIKYFNSSTDLADYLDIRYEVMRYNLKYRKSFEQGQVRWLKKQAGKKR